MLKVVFFFLIKWSKLKTLETHLYLYIKRVHVVCAVIIGIVLHGSRYGRCFLFELVNLQARGRFICVYMIVSLHLTGEKFRFYKNVFIHVIVSLDTIIIARLWRSQHNGMHF